MDETRTSHPTGLLLEYRQDGRRSWAYRFYQDGLVKEYSDTEMTFKDGKIITRKLALAWREITHLPASELDKLIRCVRQADFFALPEQIGTPARDTDAPVYTWTVILDGQEKTVVASGAEATSHPSILLLRECIQEVTAAAFEVAENGHPSQDASETAD